MIQGKNVPRFEPVFSSVRAVVEDRLKSQIWQDGKEDSKEVYARTPHEADDAANTARFVNTGGNGPGRIRTSNQRIMSPLLCP